MQELFHFAGGKGYCDILENVEDWHYLEYGLIILEKGDIYEDMLPEDREAFFNILEGELTIITEDGEGAPIERKLGSRRTVFEGNCCGFYLPRNKQYRVIANSHVEIAVVKAMTFEDSIVSFVTPEDVIREKRGKNNWTRDCSLIDIPSTRLTVGEVHKPSGNWSGAPPHKHDHDDSPNETVQEELYFFRFAKPRGFGIQRIYDATGNNQLYLVKNNDTIAIRRGYHEVVAGPGYDMWYFFALGGPNKELIPKFDPDELWINEA